MRSSIRPAVIAAALALSACGNYSTEDLRFLAALPQREDLTFEVPRASTQGALTACPPANASVWLEAKPTADKINAGVDLLLSLVDTVRRLTPTSRSEDVRLWGPFDDERHPGRELRVVMERSYPADLGGEARYGYAFQARVKGTAGWASVIVGEFRGGSAARGDGGMVLDFGAMHDVGIADDTTPATGNMQIVYDRAGDPVTLQLLLSTEGFGAVQFGYRSATRAAGGGVFDFAFRDANQNLLYVSTRYDARGAGRAAVWFQGANNGPTGGYEQCWGANACLVWVNDPLNLSCAATEQPCSYGAPTDVDCPDPLPVSPFP